MRFGRMGVGRSLCLALWVVAGCRADAEPETAPDAVQRDSAGVHIVESFGPSWTDESRWMIDPAPALEIGADEADPNQHLFAVAAVRRLRDGTIVILNAGSRDARVFDASGGFVRSVGGPGEGPGEFERLRSLATCGQDTLVVGELSRVSLLDAGGSFLRTEPVVPRLTEVPRGVWGVSRDCSHLLLLDRPSRPPVAGGYRLPLIFYWASTRDAARDTIDAFEGHTMIWIPQEGVWDIPVPFSSTTEWASRGDRVYLGHSDRFEVRVFEREMGLERIVRWHGDLEPINAEDRARFNRFRAEMVSSNPAMEALMPPLDGYPLSDRKPTFSRIEVDDEGYLWVQRYPAWAAGFPAAASTRPDGDAGAERWWVIHPEGHLLGSVVMPEGLEVHDISGGYVIGRNRAEMDVEVVRLHRVVRGPG